MLRISMAKPRLQPFDIQIGSSLSLVNPGRASCASLSLVIPGREAKRREPGIHPTAIIAAQWIPGSCFARPGMTRERPVARRLAAQWHDGQDCASHRPQISGLRAAVPFRQEGRFAIVTNAGWDVVDARASARQGVAGLVLKEPVSDTEGAQRRTTFRAYGKTVWS